MITYHQNAVRQRAPEPKPEPKPKAVKPPKRRPPMVNAQYQTRAAMLRRLWSDESMQLKEMAALLGITTPGVSLMAKRLGLPARKGKRAKEIA